MLYSQLSVLQLFWRNAASPSSSVLEDKPCHWVSGLQMPSSGICPCFLKVSSHDAYSESFLGCGYAEHTP